MKFKVGDLVCYTAPSLLRKRHAVGLVCEVYEREDRIRVLWFRMGHRGMHKGLHDMDRVKKVEVQNEV